MPIFPGGMSVLLVASRFTKIIPNHSKMSDPAPRRQPRRRRRRTSPPKSASASADPSEPQKIEGGARPVAPTKAETALLPAFPGLAPEQIHVPMTESECKAAMQKIIAAELVGFDTEAKPTFKLGEKSSGPHVVQFALTDRAYLLQLHREPCLKMAADLIASKQVLKVGFGLKNDHGQIRHRLGIELKHVLDLDQVFRKIGYRGQIGVRGAIGALLQQSFPKSKSVTTSNWAAFQLTPRQLLYAANDAFAALKVMEALRTQGYLEP